MLFLLRYYVGSSRGTERNRSYHNIITRYSGSFIDYSHVFLEMKRQTSAALERRSFLYCRNESFEDWEGNVSVRTKGENVLLRGEGKPDSHILKYMIWLCYIMYK